MELSCAKCEHDLASPLVNSTQQHGAHPKEGLPGSVLCSLNWLFWSLLLSNQSQTIAIQQNHVLRAPLAFAKRRASGFGDPRSISPLTPCRCLRCCCSANRDTAQSRSVLWSQLQLAYYRTGAISPFFDGGQSCRDRNLGRNLILII